MRRRESPEMAEPEYQVMRVKPEDLEDALNQVSRRGWQIQTIVAAEFAGRTFFMRQTLDVTRYHVILKRIA